MAHKTLDTAITATKHKKSCRCHTCQFERKFGRSATPQEREVLEAMNATEQGERAEARKAGLTLAEYRLRKYFPTLA